jgi:hypothetical protein
MKAIIIYFGIPVLIVSLFIGFSHKSSGGKAGYTGSPGENTCVSCHDSFSLNSGSSVALDNLENGFYADSTYTLNITIEQADATLFGFGLEALNSKNENAGILKITQSQKTQLMNATVGGKSRTNVVHKKNSGVANNSITFSVDWTAPSNESLVTFYVVANAANNDGGSGDDYIYSLSKSLTKIEAPVAISYAEAEKMVVYPNPAINWVTFQTPNDSYDYDFYIYQVNGQLLAKEFSNNFSISNYKPGIYTVTAKCRQDAQIVLQSKFIKTL